MKRKEAIAFIDETVDYIAHCEANVGVLDTTTGEELPVDGEMLLISVGVTMGGIKQLIDSNNLDGITSNDFITKTLEAICKSYIATKHAK